MKTLIIAAHPDDEVLGCGGTIGRLSQEGHDVYITILGEGISSRYEKREHADHSLIRALKERSMAVAKFLGAKDVTLCDLPDNRFDTVPLLDIVKLIEETIDRVSPEVVYTQHGGDLNVDHERVYRATLTATRPVSGSLIQRVYAYEVPSSTEWAFHSFTPFFRPNSFMDIGDTLEAKIEAVKLYESEIRDFPHPRSPEVLRSIARRWGSVAGLEAVEAFELVREIR
jgi:LmbE family N-acetylglucosaminyl deacetylase